MAQSSYPPVVCFSTADWDAPLWTNKQHLMSRLAERGLVVLYIDSPGHRAPVVSQQDLGRILRRLRVWRPHAHPAGGSLLRDSPLIVPFHGRRWVRDLNHSLLARRLERNCRRFGLDGAVLWAYTPTAARLYDPSRHRALVYHCVDHLSAYPGVDAEQFLEEEKRLIDAADVSIASSRPLERRLQDLGARRVLYWPNPADTQTFSLARRPRGRDRPVAGFVGAIRDHTIDVSLLKESASHLPEWEFWLVGPIGLGPSADRIDPTAFPSNVRFLGLRPREELPELLRRFDVALIPYRITDYMTHVFPMKVFEYLAAGLPVVSTPLPSLVGEVEHVVFAATGSEFAREIHGLFEETKQESGLAAARASYADRFSWEHRTEEALSLLKELAERGQPDKSTADT